MTQQHVPRSEINGWNWGAFLLNWIWGLGNKTYIALLCWIPVVNVIMMVVLGAKGNQWAWENERWDSVEHFKRVQRKWAIAGFITYGAFFLLFTLFFWGVFHGLKNSDAYRLSAQTVKQSQQVQNVLGTPVKVEGMSSGSINNTNGNERAKFVFDVKGSQYSGTAYSRLIKQYGTWHVTELYISVPGLQKTIKVKGVEG